MTTARQRLIDNPAFIEKPFSSVTTSTDPSFLFQPLQLLLKPNSRFYERIRKQKQKSPENEPHLNRLEHQYRK
tara:strand:+ start:350 stop:568 length:219 start_codon:yes stop_codon:yes gene_type:complete